MATLREQVEAIIEAGKENPSQAAIDICKLFDDNVGLSGNGWFDDDQVMLDAL